MTSVQWFLRGHSRLMMSPKYSLEIVYRGPKSVKLMTVRSTVWVKDQGVGGRKTTEHTQTSEVDNSFAFVSFNSLVFIGRKRHV